MHYAPRRYNQYFVNVNIYTLSFKMVSNMNQVYILSLYLYHYARHVSKKTEYRSYSGTQIRHENENVQFSHASHAPISAQSSTPYEKLCIRQFVTAFFLP